MKLAYVVSDLSYPPREGLHEQTIVLLKGLVARGIRVELFGFAKDDSCIDARLLSSREGIHFTAPPVRYRGSSLLRAVRLRLPFDRVRKAYVELLSDPTYDVVHYEGVTACALVERNPRRPYVVSMIDPGSRRNLRMARHAGSMRGGAAHFAAALVFLGMERRTSRPGSTWHVVSSEDAKYLRRVHHHRRTWAIPMAIPAHIAAVFDSPDARSDILPQPARIRVLVYGDFRQRHLCESLTRFGNHVFKKSAWAEHVEFRIMSRAADDDSMFEAFAGLNFTNFSWVEDTAAEIRSCDFVFLPDEIGTGIKTRAIQAMGIGRAVLAGPAAFEGIPIADGVSAVVGKTYTDFLQKFDLLCCNAERRASIGREGRKMVVETYSPDGIVAGWLECYESARVAFHPGPR